MRLLKVVFRENEFPRPTAGFRVRRSPADWLTAQTSCFAAWGNAKTPYWRDTMTATIATAGEKGDYPDEGQLFLFTPAHNSLSRRPGKGPKTPWIGQLSLWQKTLAATKNNTASGAYPPSPPRPSPIVPSRKTDAEPRP